MTPLPGFRSGIVPPLSDLHQDIRNAAAEMTRRHEQALLDALATPVDIPRPEAILQAIRSTTGALLGADRTVPYIRHPLVQAGQVHVLTADWTNGTEILILHVGPPGEQVIEALRRLGYDPVEFRPREHKTEAAE